MLERQSSIRASRRSTPEALASTPRMTALDSALSGLDPGVVDVDPGVVGVDPGVVGVDCREKCVDLAQLDEGVADDVGECQGARWSRGSVAHPSRRVVRDVREMNRSWRGMRRMKSTMTNSISININMATLHVLTERALRVFVKYKDVHPAIAGFESTLVPAANGFTDAFKAVQSHRATKSRDLIQGHADVQKLVDGVRSWLGMVARDLPGFDMDVELEPGSPDRVIGYAENLVAVIEHHKDALPYAAALLEHIGSVLVPARAEWERAQQALGDLQVMRRTLREQGIAMNRELVAFRRTLRTVLGTSNRDFQLLRASRAAADEASVVGEVAPPDVARLRMSQPTTPTNGIAVHS